MHSDASDPTLRVSTSGRPPSSQSGKGWQPPAPEELQEMLPQYAITLLLGRGGMGAVYKGVQKNLDRPVAIKILPLGMDDGEDDGSNFTERFKNEARAMARLSHPGIVAVYDFGETSDGLLYIVMEFIEGTDVQKMVSEQGRLHSAHALAITAHLCDALQYAHERGIVHRDIKPANIMVGYDGVVKVADFGLAKMNRAGESGLTRSGMAMGTLHYMAPEALMLGHSVDHRADIYAVGVMLYCMLTGKLPQGMFQLPSLQVPGLDPRFDGIIARALRDDRDIRYQTTAELRYELDGILTQPVVKVEAGATPPPPSLPTDARPQQPHGRQAPARVEQGGFPIAWLAVIILSGLAAWIYLRNPTHEVAADAPPAVADATPAPAAPTPSAPPASTQGPSPTPSAAPTTAPQTSRPPPAPGTSKIQPPEETLPVTPNLKTGVWYDVLNAGLQPHSGLAKRVDGSGKPAGYEATGGVLCASTMVVRDCVVRARFSGAWSIPPSVFVRYQEASSNRYIASGFINYMAQLRYHLQNNWMPFVMNDMEKQVSRDEALEVELRAVGDHYTLRKSGVLVAEGTLAGFPVGRVGFTAGKGVVIEQLEVMPLESAAPPATAPAPATATKAGPDGWHPLLEERPDLVQKMNIRDAPTPGWKIMPANFTPVLDAKDVALRLRLRNYQNFRVVTHWSETPEQEIYGHTLQISKDNAGTVRFAGGWISHVSPVRGAVHPTGYRPYGQRPAFEVPEGTECEVEMRAYEDQVEVWLDGRQVLQTALKLPGRVTAMQPYGNLEFKDLAWRPLPPRRSAPPGTPAGTPPVTAALAPTPRDTRDMKLLVDTDFRQTQGSFRDVRMPDMVAVWQDGTYQMSNRARTQWYPPMPMLHDLALKDFVYETEYRVPHSAPGMWGVALAPQKRPVIEVRVDAAGRAAIFRPQMGELLRWTGTKAAHPGGGWNLLRVEGVGDTLRLFVNQVHVADVSRANIETPHGLSMFIASAGETFEADLHRVRVWEPGASAAAPAPGAAAAAASPALPREWIDTQGRKITAAFVRADKTTLTLRNVNGQEINVLLNKLSEPSKRLAEQLEADSGR